MQLIFLIFLNLPLGFIDMMAFMDAVKEIEAVCHKIVFQELFEFSPTEIYFEPKLLSDKNLNSFVVFIFSIV